MIIYPYNYISTKMKIISLINSKGGVGKTTLSVCIAAYLKTQNKKVLLVDADPQGSLRDWKELGGDDNDFEITVADRRQVLINLPKLIKHANYDYGQHKM
jgi:chromosome partitioning protein